MAQVTSEDDILFSNRFNIALARSQRLLSSWIQRNPVAQGEGEDHSNEDTFNERDFTSQTEKGGVDSKAAYAQDDTLPDGSFQRKKLSSNDRLLENILGQKAAQARKKSQAPGKAMSASKHAEPKPLTARPKALRKNDSDEDEAGGRAAAFKSRSQRNRAESLIENARKVDQQMDDPVDEERNPVVKQPGRPETSTAAAPQAESKPTKSKATSYLDELLAEKANKKSKKKKKSNPPT